MNFPEAKQFTLESSHDPKLIAEAEERFREDLKLTKDSEKIIECTYGLLVCALKKNLTETSAMKKLFKAYNDYLTERLAHLKSGFSKSNIDSSLTTIVFMNSGIYHLELLQKYYEYAHFHDRATEVYITKMRFIEELYRVEGKWIKWSWYRYFRAIARYGTSSMRLVFSTLIITFLFAVIFFSLDHFEIEKGLIEEQSMGGYFYTSVGVISNLGADIHPISFLGQCIVSIEAFFGVLLVGLLLYTVNKRMG